MISRIDIFYDFGLLKNRYFIKLCKPNDIDMILERIYNINVV